MSNLLVRFVTYIRGGGLITFVGTRVNQAVYWSALCYDPETDYWWPPIGQLLRERTKTDKTMLTINGYKAPERQPHIRWGTMRLWGEHIWAEEWFVNDHVTAKWSD